MLNVVRCSREPSGHISLPWPVEPSSLICWFQTGERSICIIRKLIPTSTTVALARAQRNASCSVFSFPIVS